MDHAEDSDSKPMEQVDSIDGAMIEQME